VVSRTFEHAGTEGTITPSFNKALYQAKRSVLAAIATRDFGVGLLAQLLVSPATIAAPVPLESALDSGWLTDGMIANPPQDRAVALGMSHFVASGDNGAYTCGLDQDAAASFPSTLPTVTAVGGTSVFESQQGIYYKEYAWGSPIDQSGGGGGASVFYSAPAYQQHVVSSQGHGFRQVPDVAADADPSTGFHIVFGGAEGQAGGTSAATPLWAATIALINQDMKKKGLREVGFANGALYWMGENLAKFSTKPFHDVTAGNNLGYDAVAGWDFATGWGSMDAAAMDAAWATYIKGGGG